MKKIIDAIVIVVICIAGIVFAGTTIYSACIGMLLESVYGWQYYVYISTMLIMWLGSLYEVIDLIIKIVVAFKELRG